MTFEHRNYATRYFATLDRVARAISATDAHGVAQELNSAVERFAQMCRESRDAGGRLMFIGNGGSASIASHMAVDFSKNGGVPAAAFNDPMFLTCLSNDLGYENVFAFQIEQNGRAADTLVAISSSGKSANILKGVAAARKRDAKVVTLSGFGADNPLRGGGDLNFYVPAAEYGYVELLHSCICHCVLDSLMDVRTD